MKITKLFTVGLVLLTLCNAGALELSNVPPASAITFDTQLLAITNGTKARLATVRQVRDLALSGTTNQWQADAATAANAATNSLLSRAEATNSFLKLHSAADAVATAVTNQWRIDATNAASGVIQAGAVIPLGAAEFTGQALVTLPVAYADAGYAISLTMFGTTNAAGIITNMPFVLSRTQDHFIVQWPALPISAGGFFWLTKKY